MKFAYQRYAIEPSPEFPKGILYRPEVPLRIIGTMGDATVLALVDTGADLTLPPRSIGEAIGVAMGDGPISRASGIAGQEVEVALAVVELELAQGRTVYQWSAKVGFVAFATPEDEVAVMGHAGSLHHFVARFHGRRHELELRWIG